MSYDIKQSTTQSVLLFFLTLSSDHISPATGKTPTVTLSKNGAAFGAPAGAVTEIANGWYKVAGNATDTNTLGPLALHATEASSDPCDLIVANIVAYDPQTAGATLTAGAQTALVNALWDEATSSHKTPGSFGGQMQSVQSGTAQAGGATSITLAAGASASNSFYNNCLLVILSGTGVGQARFITAYVGATKVATVGTWVSNPDNTSVYTLIPFDALPGSSAPTAAQNATAVWAALLSGNTTAGSFGEQLGYMQVRRNTAQSGTASSITLDAGASATNDLYKYNQITIFSGTGAGESRQITGYTGSSKVAAVAPNWTVAPDNTSVFAITAFGLDAATVSTIAAAVWEELRSAHTTAGSMGEYVRADAQRVAGDASAATNAAAAFNGTGFNFPNTTIPNVTTVTGNVNGSVASVAGAVASVTGNVGGNVVGTVASVAGDVSGNVAGNLGGNVTGTVGSLAAQAKTDVKTQAVAALNTDTYTEPGQGAPGVTVTLAQKIGYLYKAWRNLNKQTASGQTLYSDDGVTVDQKATISDDGTTFQKSKIVSGP